MIDYIKPSFFVNSDHPDVIQWAITHSNGLKDEISKAIALYYAVRDGFKYNPYIIDLNKEVLKASDLVTRSRQEGYCIEKACLLAACGRALGIPSRLGFAQVKNHIGTEKIQEFLKTDLLVFHGYTEFYLNEKWIKCTPAFNKELCNKFNVRPLEFDGLSDSVFQEFDNHGGHFMDYVHDYGQFEDIPYDLMISEFAKYYPHFFTDYGSLRVDLSEHKDY